MVQPGAPSPGGQVIIIDLVGDPHWGQPDWHIAKAFRDARQSFLQRSRDREVAADLIRLYLHPTWLKHCFNDIPLLPSQFHATYEQVFPGADFEGVPGLGIVMAMYWHRPNTAPPLARAVSYRRSSSCQLHMLRIRTGAVLSALLR